MAEWPMVRFEELAADEKSAFSKPYGSAYTKRDYVADGVPVVRGVNLGSGIFHDDDFVFITEEKADQLPGANLAPRDLVITHRGTIGQVSMIPRSPRYPRYVLSTSQVKARLDSASAIPEFYYYWLSSPAGQHEILGHVSTVGVPGLVQPVASVKGFKVPRPSIREQAAVAGVLGALDDKIAVNERIASSALNLAKSLYSRAAEASRESAALADLIDLKYGKSLPAARRKNGLVPVFGSGGVSGSHNKSLVPGPGIVVGRKGTVGAIYWSQDDFFPIDTTFYVSLKSPAFSMEYIYFALQDLGLGHMNSDSAVPGLNRANALALRIKTPTPACIASLTQRVRQLFNLKNRHEKENSALVDLRDTLLPHLMSGKLRVREAEKIVEDAV